MLTRTALTPAFPQMPQGSRAGEMSYIFGGQHAIKARTQGLSQMDGNWETLDTQQKRYTHMRETDQAVRNSPFAEPQNDSLLSWSYCGECPGTQLFFKIHMRSRHEISMPGEHNFTEALLLLGRASGTGLLRSPVSCDPVPQSLEVTGLETVLGT